MTQVPALPKYSLLPGWTCLVVAFFSILFMGPVIGSIIAAPLSIAAFVFSIIGLTRNNVTGGVLLMVLTFIMPPVAFIASLVIAYGPSMKKHAASDDPPAIPAAWIASSTK